MRTLPVLLLTAMGWALGGGASDAVAQDDRVLAAGCAGCHGTEGRSAGEIPALAGVERARLLAALREFRDGQRAATVMHQHARGYTDAEFERLADYFSSRAATDRTQR